MWTWRFWRDAIERAVRTTAQAVCALLIGGGTGLFTTDWKTILSAAGMAAILSVLTSLASEIKNPDGTAALYPKVPPLVPEEPSPKVPAARE